MTFKFKLKSIYHLIIHDKIIAPNNYTVIFTQNYLETLLKVTFRSFQSNNVVKTPYE